MPPPHDTSVQPDALPDAMLLAITGGLLDAVVYLNHGHVFANAMSGNVIFLGIAIIGRDWGDIVPHLVPLAGFFSGVLTSKHLRARMGIHSVLLGLALEIVAIFVLGWLPIGFPHMAFTTIIAYVIPYTGAISQPGEKHPLHHSGRRRIRSLHRQRQSMALLCPRSKWPDWPDAVVVNRQVHVTYQ